MLRKTTMLLSIVALSILSVEAATVSGVVKEGDSTGAAVDSAIVTLTATGAGGFTLRDTTDATGAYSFSSVSIGTRQIRAAKTGFVTTPQTSISITDSSATYTQNLYLVSASVRATVSGTVTDSVAGTPLAGAKVLLRIGTGGSAFTRDSVVTGASGSYSFDTVPAGSFTLVTSDSGYNPRTTTGYVTSAIPLTIDIKLVKILYGSITGTVTDSVAGTPIAGAKVYLRTNTGGGTPLDSAVTAANGSYTIANVQTGILRNLRAQDSGFVTKNTPVTVVDTAALTVNIQLVKILYGSITGTVSDSAAGTPIEGAKVYLRSTGGGATNLDSAVTAANGSYSIAHVQTNIARSVRAQDSGFITKNTTVTVIDTAALTVDIKLVKILYGSIIGTVTDSVAGTPIEGAKVYLRSTGGGATNLDSAVTAANGSYTIAHVQTNIARTLRVQDSGFVTKNTPVTVVDTAALTVNIELRKATVAIASPNAQGILRNPDFFIASSGILRLSNFNESGTIMVFGLQGRLLYRSSIRAHTTSLALPAHFAKSGNSYIVGITQNNVVYRKQVIMP